VLLGMPVSKFSVGVDTLNVGAGPGGGLLPPGLPGPGVPDEPPDPPPPHALSNRNTPKPHSVRLFEIGDMESVLPFRISIRSDAPASRAFRYPSVNPLAQPMSEAAIVQACCSEGLLSEGEDTRT
jgi:hypothetical protein